MISAIKVMVIEIITPGFLRHQTNTIAHRLTHVAREPQRGNDTNDMYMQFECTWKPIEAISHSPEN